MLSVAGFVRIGCFVVCRELCATLFSGAHTPWNKMGLIQSNEPGGGSQKESGSGIVQNKSQSHVEFVAEGLISRCLHHLSGLFHLLTFPSSTLMSACILHGPLSSSRRYLTQRYPTQRDATTTHVTNQAKGPQGPP